MRTGSRGAGGPSSGKGGRGLPIAVERVKGWFHPWGAGAPGREHGVPLLPGATESGDGAGGGSRTPKGRSPADFLTFYGFRRPRFRAASEVWGLDYLFTIPRT